MYIKSSYNVAFSDVCNFVTCVGCALQLLATNVAKVMSIFKRLLSVDEHRCDCATIAVIYCNDVNP